MQTCLASSAQRGALPTQTHRSPMWHAAKRERQQLAPAVTMTRRVLITARVSSMSTSFILLHSSLPFTGCTAPLSTPQPPSSFNHSCTAAPHTPQLPSSSNHSCTAAPGTPQLPSSFNHSCTTVLRTPQMPSSSNHSWTVVSAPQPPCSSKDSCVAAASIP